jgi:acetolactate synthase-1/2/3 large subunit
MFRGDAAGCALGNPDFVALAKAFGLEAARAETPTAVEQAVAAAIRSGRPTLIDIPIDPAPAPYRLQAVFDSLSAP